MAVRLYGDAGYIIATISLTLVILIFAFSGPLNEFVRRFIETTTSNYEELSRRQKRILFKEHWLGAIHYSLEKNFFFDLSIFSFL